MNTLKIAIKANKTTQKELEAKTGIYQPKISRLSQSLCDRELKSKMSVLEYELLNKELNLNLIEL